MDNCDFVVGHLSLCRVLIHIHGRIHLTLYEQEEALKLAGSKYLVIPPSKIDVKEFLPSLTHIFKFDEMARNIARRNPTQKLIFCAGSDSMTRVHTVFLITCHVMISHGADIDEVYPTLDRMHDLLDSARSEYTGSSVFSGLLSISRAKMNGWIDFRETFDTGPINSYSIAMDEYLHYARCAVILPSPVLGKN